MGLFGGSKSRTDGHEPTHPTGFTEEQKAGQQRLNEQLAENRRAPAEGNPIPEGARRDGRLDG